MNGSVMQEIPLVFTNDYCKSCCYYMKFTEPKLNRLYFSSIPRISLVWDRKFVWGPLNRITKDASYFHLLDVIFLIPVLQPVEEIKNIFYLLLYFSFSIPLLLNISVSIKHSNSETWTLTKFLLWLDSQSAFLSHRDRILVPDLQLVFQT